MAQRSFLRAQRALRIGFAISVSLSSSACVVTARDGSSAAAPIGAASAAPARFPSSANDVSASAWPLPDADRDGGTDGASRGLSVMTWNLEWFADADAGPKDDATQYARVLAILRELDEGLVALEEVASEDAFERLARSLPRYASALSGYDWTQKTALLWDASRFELADVHALTGLADAGRPPLVVSLRDKRDGRVLVAVVVHAKAQADRASYDERVQFSNGLKADFDREYPTTPLIVLGDFNDRLIGSITDGADSPYRNFVADPHYAAPTAVLDQPSQAEASYATGSTIDHVIVSDELAARVDPHSVAVLRARLLAQYSDYVATVSDHFPVTLSIDW